MRRRLPDIFILMLLFALPLVMFWQQTLGGRTLLPTENLYQFEPFATYRDQMNVPEPHNALVSDLVLENFQWKTFIRQSIAQGEIPLWNPHQFSGIPFLAAGQQSTLYPFSIIYYVMPLTAAYGWFTVVQLWLAGAFMYAFMRGLGVRRTGALVSGIIYQLSAFFVISAVFPMIIAAAVWLPLLLLMVEYVIRQQPALRGRPSTIPWIAIGAVALGCNILAGHVEITYYTLIIMAYYAALRLLWLWWNNRRSVGAQGLVPLRHLFKRTCWLALMVTLGIGIGAIQFIPLFELASTNWRSGSASYDQVIDWAHKVRDIVQFVMPNFYGNPSHHSYVDVFTGQVVTQFTRADGTPTSPLNTIDWGIKNYVEGALYLGILPLVLSVYALLDGWIRFRNPLPASPVNGGGDPRDSASPSLLAGRAANDSSEWGGEIKTPPYRFIFGLLALVSLTFMFGLPTYALLFYGFPGINQLHSPFRWIFGLTLSVAMLAGFGADALARSRRENRPAGDSSYTNPSGLWAKRIGWILIATGTAILVALLLSRVFYAQVEPLIERIFSSMAKANEAFADAGMFYSYQFRNVLFFGLFTLSAGIVMRVSRCPIYFRNPLPTSPVNGGGDTNATDSPSLLAGGNRIPIWQLLAVVVIALDLMVASWGFNPASDPALLDFTPPAIEWLTQQPGDWRYTTLDDPAQRPLMQANVGWRYGLDDIRGYESIIPGQYVNYMQLIAPQYQLDFNRIAPLRTTDTSDINGLQLVGALYDWGLRLLNVRYVITHNSTDIGDWYWSLAYEDEAVRIWENRTYFPRAYTYPFSINNAGFGADAWYEGRGEAAIISDTGREKLIDVSAEFSTWLVVSENYFPGWRAFIRPHGSNEDQEQPAEVERVEGIFQGVHLPETGDWTVRLVYSPTSFQVGMFGTFISAVLVIFLLGVWLWRLYVARDEQASGAAIVAHNSVAPIILNLFNRGIDFAFAFVMLRILGPDGAGVYYYAIIIFGWFDIFTNFGLNTFLTREVSRDRAHAGRYLFNTSALRILLALLGILLLAGFITARQSAVSPPLSSEALLAIILLYIGLLPNSLSTGMSALFYAFEKAEIPAAIATVATISKTVFGLAALLLGYGVVGLAGVSILTNVITLAIMAYVGRDLIRIGRGDLPDRPYKPDTTLMRRMLGESWPLMLNHFLATIFFQIDVILIEAIHGDTMVGQYSVAYKWVSALNIIPAFFTMALLPVMSRQAKEDPAALKRNYGLAIKLLVSVALPVAVLFTFLAVALTYVLGGAEFLPDGAIATQLMIWSIPIGWMNSLTQYVLIALDLQRRITRAFILAVSFNIIANLIFIPQYGYRAAAIVTILSEAILLIPFGLLLQSALGKIPWLEYIWRPLVAAGAMAAVLLVGWQIQPVLAVIAALVVYPAVLLMLRPFSEDELARLRPLLPGRLKRLVQRPV